MLISLPLLLACTLNAAQQTPAQQTKIPVVSADSTGVPQPPKPIEPGVKGYGTRGVEGETLSDMVRSCQVQTQRTRLLAARCDQLKRSLKTQPDGTVDETLKRSR